MPQQHDPAARSRYNVEITGAVNVARLKAELRKLAKAATPLDPNRVSVSPSDYTELEREIFGRTGTGGEISLVNTLSNTRVVITKWTTVQPGTVEFWSQQS